MSRRRLAVVGALVVLPLASGAVAVWRVATDHDAPRLPGRLVYVSDRGGMDGLFLRDLATGREQSLDGRGGPARDPSCAPDGRRVAFAAGGRIAVLDVTSGDLRLLTPGDEWLDAAPDWRGDGRALVVASRRQRDAPADLHELDLDGDPRAPLGVTRRFLTQTAGLDEQAPAYGYDGSFALFVRQDGLYRIDLRDGTTRRLTPGFKRFRAPRLMPNGDFVAPWSLAKSHGIDVLSPEGAVRRTIYEGGAYYEVAAPSPDGRLLAATFGYDLAFTLRDALRPRGATEVRALDAQGRVLGTLVTSWRNAQHSACWLR